jgi:Anti-sigma-K factor rskA/Putative zinc-finger
MALAAHEDYKSLVAAQALDALDAGELRSLEEHLSTCAECRTELDELRGIAAKIALSAPAVEPPEALRDRILAVARMTPQAKTPQAISSEPIPDILPTEPDSGSNNVVSLVPREMKPSNRLKFLAVAASLAFFAALIGLLMIWKQEQQTRGQMSELTNRLARTESDLARERELREAFASPDARLAELRGTASAPLASAKFAVDRSTGRAVLLAYNLPAPPAGKEYQLWYIADGKPLPGGVFKTDGKGNGELKGIVSPEGRAASVFAVTMEPPGGGLTPTSAPILVSQG